MKSGRPRRVMRERARARAHSMQPPTVPPSLPLAILDVPNLPRASLPCSTVSRSRCLRVPLGHSTARMRNLAIMTSCTMTPQHPIGGARRRRRRRSRVVVAVFLGTWITGRRGTAWQWLRLSARGVERTERERKRENERERERELAYGDYDGEGIVRATGATPNG